MSRTRSFYNLAFAFLIIAFTNPVFALIEIEPYGFAVSIAEGENSEVEFIVSNTGENLVAFEINYEAQFRMLAFDPENGEIAGQDITGINATIMPENAEAGVYEFLVDITISNHNGDDGEIDIIPISAVISVASPSTDLTGIISSSRDGEVIPDAKIMLDRYEIVRYSNEEGNYVFTDLPSGNYEFTISANDYLTRTFEVNIEEGEIEINFELPQAECVLEPIEIEAQLAPGEANQFNIEASNPGNGPLIYSVVRHAVSEFEPWEVRERIPFGEILEDSRIRGTIFTDDMYYVAHSNNREPIISVLNRDGELIREFAQPNREGSYGFTDLAFDGAWIWGGGSREITALNLDGEVMRQFDGPYNPVQYLAWDSDQELLWVSGITSPISSIDRDGNEIDELDGLDFRIHGLAFYADDPDGYQLYIFHLVPRVNDPVVHKMNTANGDTLYVTNIVDEWFDAAYITDEYDTHDWVLLMHHYDEDAEFHYGNSILQIDGRRDWMQIDPEEGVIEAGEDENFELTINEIDLPEGDYDGEIVFVHDGVGGETHLPISLQVGEDGGDEPVEMVINLVDGWSMASAYVQPDPDDVAEITAELVDAGSLIMMKNGIGQFFLPEQNFNNIPGWFVDKGYLINMDRADNLTIMGEAVPWDQPIGLAEGWQIVSYYPRQDVDAVTALSGIVDVLLMAKDGLGRFYNPEFEFSNMGDMVSGQGYLMKLQEAIELVYTFEEEVDNSSIPYITPNILPIHPSTSENMSLLILSETREGEIGVYATGKLVGSGVIQDGRCGIAVWGDDTSTEEIEGAVEGEALKLKLWDNKRQIERDLLVNNILRGKRLIYQTNEFIVAEIIVQPAIPSRYYLSQNYPNPFNSTTILPYGLPESSQLSISVFDIAGRLVETLVNGNIEAGYHTVNWEASTIATGVYLVKMETVTFSSVRKVILVR